MVNTCTDKRYGLRCVTCSTDGQWGKEGSGLNASPCPTPGAIVVWPKQPACDRGVRNRHNTLPPLSQLT